MTQLSDIRTEVLETAGLASDDSRFPSATLNRIINRALRSISAEHDWPWNQAAATINTTASSGVSTLPTDTSKIIRLSIDNDDLILFPAREGVTYSEDSGQPRAYWVEQEKVNWAPVPDAVYAVSAIYSKYETALSSDSDAPNLPTRYTDWLVNTCLVQVSQRIRDNDLYSMADRERLLWSRRAADEVRRVYSSGRPQVRTGWGRV